MPVTTEKATVFKGGGRRYFSKSAAIHSEARASFRAAVRSKEDRCNCETIDDDMFGGTYTSPCKYHDHGGPVFVRYMRFAKHCIAKVSQ